ncbi:MAG: carboxypeptidase regulatory-like domain-containing protein, partial [Gammaproteobacteria bacterium]|nr:carboxypeptidase regulatory-like domain-containing protein [Gammaproteobacteria bacterium]
MSRLISRFILISLVLLWSASSYAGKASEFLIYVLADGLPVENAEIFINNSFYKKTNKNGFAKCRLSKGQVAIEVKNNNVKLYGLNVSINNLSNSLLIIHQLKNVDRPVIDLESSDSSIASNASINANLIKTKDQSKGEAVIKGYVTSLVSGVPVPGAQVYISGVAEKIKTDENGRFEYKVSSGVYAMSIVHGDFSMQSVTDITLVDKEVFSRNFELTPAAKELEEFTVTAPLVEGGSLALIDEKRNTSSVVEVLGSEQMSNAGDSDAAGALKRVTGLTLIDGKYVYVRGLGERYSSITLNNAGVPSPDPTRRVVPLDLFPTGMLESIVVQKTFSPDMPGDFAGGVVQLRTKGIPEEKVRKLSVSTGFNTNTTFQEGYRYQGGDTDFLGIDDGGRDMPAFLNDVTNGGATQLSSLDSDVLEAAGESLPVNYQVTGFTIRPDIGLKLNMADRNKSYDSDWGWGYNFAFNYSNKWHLSEEEHFTYGLDGSGGLIQFDNYQRTRTTNEVNLGGMLNFTAEFGNSGKIESTTLLTRKTSNSVFID